MCPYSTAFMNTLRCKFKWTASPLQRSSWTRERYRALPSPPCETQRQKEASAESRKRKTPGRPQFISKAVLQKTQDLENLTGDSADDTQSDDEDVVTACDELTRRSLLQRCATCSRNRSPHHFKSESNSQCTQCFKAWIPRGIRYQGDELKTVHGKTPIRLLGIHHNMWLDAKSQRHKVIHSAIEVAGYLYKNDNLWIDQRLKVISMCLPSLFSFSAPLIDWLESDLKLLTAVWIRAYKNAWNVGKSTATCLFTFPRDKGGLQVNLPLGTLFTSVWGNLERCSQFDDGTRQMLALNYQEALQENGCLNLLELQDASQHLSWKAQQALMRSPSPDIWPTSWIYE